jgi:hypothetical protein
VDEYQEVVMRADVFAQTQCILLHDLERNSRITKILHLVFNGGALQTCHLGREEATKEGRP